LLLDTWLSNFPEDFIAAPDDAHEEDPLEPDDDWRHRPSTCGENKYSFSIKTDEKVAVGKSRDSMDLLIDLIKFAIIPCPFLCLLGMHGSATEETTPFQKCFPCLFKIYKV
jgi:hypothetical protein